MRSLPFPCLLALTSLAPVLLAGAAGAFELESAAFEDGGAIPREHTCEGRDVSPPLAWRDVPEGAESLALVVVDPDVPDPEAPVRQWVHWVLHDLPPDAGGLPEATDAEDLPAGARQATNDWGRTGYGGPCPPVGRHRYFFRLHALDVKLGDLGAPTRAELERAMKGHVLDRTELLGTYEKRGR